MMTTAAPISSLQPARTELRAYLFTDLVGSVELKQRLGDATVARLMARHNEYFRECLSRFRGKEEDNAGDGFFCSFDVPSDALRCALAFQRGLAEFDAPERLRARAGIHAGESVRIAPDQDGNYRSKLIGLAVDTAARVMSLADANQILLTRHAFDSLRQQVSAAPDGATVQYLAHGAYQLKGLPDPMEIFEAGIPQFSPLRPPKDSEKAKRALAPGEEETLGWRPAVGLEIPGRTSWKLEKRLGQGGFGEVWLARHEVTKDARTFKFCFEISRLRALKREMTIFRLIRDVLGDREDIPRLYDVRLNEKPYFLEMEYTAGGDLIDWSESNGGIATVDLATRLELIAQTAVALAAAHSVGVIHKDVKPRNVLVHERRDRTLQVRLTDFGIGQLVASEIIKKAAVTATGFDGGITEPGDLMSRTGTRLYMAPTLLAGAPASIHTDIYSLGVLLYQAIVGDFGRPLAPGWERHIGDPLLRGDVHACITDIETERLPFADRLAERLRTLEQRRAARLAQQQRAAAEARRRWLLRAAAVAIPLLIAFSIGGMVIWTQRVNLEQIAAVEALRAIVTDGPAALRRLAAAGGSLRQRIENTCIRYVTSPAYTERVLGARAALGVSRAAADAFWKSIDGGPLWQSGEWLELTRMSDENGGIDALRQAGVIAGIAAKVRDGTPRQKYVALCLLGQFADALDADAGPVCREAMARETGGPLVMAATWGSLRSRSTELPRFHSIEVFADPISQMNFVRLPGADAFRPGSPPDEAGRWSNEARPQSPVVIRGFWLAASETTLAQLQPFMESAENAQVNADIRAAFNEQMGQLGRYDPRHVAAHSVSWQVATQFCEWLTRQAEQQGAGRRYRLPTEDEWEYACRAGNDSAFCYGPDPRYLRCFGVYGGYEGEAVLPRIMTRMPNAFGLFDMHGNLWELTHTPYSERYDSRAGSPVPGVRVQRGGAAYSPAERCRSAQRNQIAQEQAVNTMGFRIVLEDLERP